MRLRHYQRRVVGEILDYAARNPTGRLLIVLPPGGGKTLVAATVLRELAQKRRKRGLVYVHRREIVDQHRRHLIESGIPARSVGVLMAMSPHANDSAPIQVASLGTLLRRGGPDADVVVSDEAHRDASRERRKLRAAYSRSFHVGFTGTPCRSDGRGLRDDYDDMIVAAQPSDLLKDGYIVSPRIFTVPDELLPDVRGARVRSGDYAEDDLDRAANRRAIVGGIVDNWLRRANGRRTIVFPVGIEHSLHIVDRLKSSGVAAEHLDGGMPISQRAAILAALRSGRLSVVSSVGVLNEGVDIPQVKCVVLARPTKSVVLHLQQCGRCLRPWGDGAALILDHAGNAAVLGPPDIDRSWSLDGLERVAGTGDAGPCVVCPACYCVMSAGAYECAECGGVLREPAPPVPKELDAELAAMPEGPPETTSDGDAEISRIERFAAERGFAREWAQHVAAAKLGLPPPSSVVRGVERTPGLRYFNFFGQDCTVKELCEVANCGISYSTMRDRLLVAKIRPEDAFQRRWMREPVYRQAVQRG